MEKTNVLKKLFNDGELPTVNVEISLSRDTIVDLAAAAVIVAIVIALLQKYILQKL
jgi:F0F1-type ATP synthase alpha subunit